MHILILKLFHFYLFNFSYIFNTVVLRQSHVTAVFVNMAFIDEDKILTKPLTSGRLTISTSKDSDAILSTCCKPTLFRATTDIQLVPFMTTQSLQKKMQRFHIHVGLLANEIIKQVILENDYMDVIALSLNFLLAKF